MTVVPLLFRVGDDWPITVTLGSDGTTDGSAPTPYDLTGASVSAELFAPFGILLLGAAVVTDAVHGIVSVVVPRTTTANVIPQTTPTSTCRLSLTIVDSLGRRRTFDPVVIVPLLQQADALAPVLDQAVVITAAAQGPAGPPGQSAATPTLTVGATPVNGHRALMFDAMGNVVHADPSAPSYVFAGLSLQAAQPGALVQVSFEGVVSDPSWSWTPFAPVFVLPGGALTQTPPASGVLQQIASALTATSMFVDPYAPITRA